MYIQGCIQQSLSILKMIVNHMFCSTSCIYIGKGWFIKIVCKNYMMQKWASIDIHTHVGYYRYSYTCP